MKKFLLFIFSTFLTTALFAQQHEIQAGVTNDFHERAGFFGPKLSYQYLLNNKWGIELKAHRGYASAENIYSGATFGDDFEGGTTRYSIIPNVNYYFSGAQNTSPYLSLGPGHFSFDRDVSYTNNFGSPSTLKDSSSGFGGNISGGLLARINENFSIDFNAGYTAGDGNYATLSGEIGYRF